MKKIDITDHVIKVRVEAKRKEAETMSTMTLPSWMKQPFDEYFAEKAVKPAENSNVINFDFSRQEFKIPKALAASSSALQSQTWYEHGSMTLQESPNISLNILLSKSSDSNEIDMDVSVSGGQSALLAHYKHQENLQCSLFDRNTELATFTAYINDDGTFMHAEGTVLHDFEPEDSNDFISLRFHVKPQ